MEMLQEAPDEVERWFEFLGRDPIQHVVQAFRHSLWAGLGTFTWDTVIILTGIAFVAWITGLLPPILYTPRWSAGFSRMHLSGGWKVALAVSGCCLVGILVGAAYFTGFYTVVLRRF